MLTKLEATDLVRAACRVWEAFRAYGPVDDGRPEGNEFESALVELGGTAHYCEKRLKSRKPHPVRCQCQVCIPSPFAQ